MAILKNERIKWEDRLCIYRAASEVLNIKIRLVKMEYDYLAQTHNYSEVQMISSRIKEMDSSMGPCYYHASKKVLNALSKPTNDWDKEWREECFRKLEAERLNNIS